jgi:hypothetical protein
VATGVRQASFEIVGCRLAKGAHDRRHRGIRGDKPSGSLSRRVETGQPTFFASAQRLRSHRIAPTIAGLLFCGWRRRPATLTRSASEDVTRNSPSLALRVRGEIAQPVRPRSAFRATQSGSISTAGRTRCTGRNRSRD